MVQAQLQVKLIGLASTDLIMDMWRQRRTQLLAADGSSVQACVRDTHVWISRKIEYIDNLAFTSTYVPHFQEYT